MKCDEYTYYAAGSDVEHNVHIMPAQCSVDWNPEAISAFIQKLNGVNRQGIAFPPLFGPFAATAQGSKLFQFALLNMLANTAGLEVRGVYHATTVVAKDYSSLGHFTATVVSLCQEPWVRAVLQHGEPLESKLAKITVYVSGEQRDLFGVHNPLFH